MGKISHIGPYAWDEIVRYPVLYGEYELSIDEKNRLLIPAEIRHKFNPDTDGSAFFIKVGKNKVPWLYPQKYYEEAAQTPPSLNPTEDNLAMDQFNFAFASLLEWDKQGRVVLPDKILKRTAVGKEVTLIGAKDHLELWSREAWTQHMEVLFARGSGL